MSGSSGNGQTAKWIDEPFAALLPQPGTKQRSLSAFCFELLFKRVRTCARKVTWRVVERRGHGVRRDNFTATGCGPGAAQPGTTFSEVQRQATSVYASASSSANFVAAASIGAEFG